MDCIETMLSEHEAIEMDIIYLYGDEIKIIYIKWGIRDKWRESCFCFSKEQKLETHRVLSDYWSELVRDLGTQFQSRCFPILT